MSRSLLRALLDRTVTHKRATYAADAGGGRSPTYATQNANVPATIWPVAYNAEIAAAFDRADIVCDHIIVTDSDLSAKAKDEIVDGSDTYLVNGAMLFRNALVANLTLYCIGAIKRIV